jgi:hypothetical protein
LGCRVYGVRLWVYDLSLMVCGFSVGRQWCMLWGVFGVYWGVFGVYLGCIWGVFGVYLGAAPHTGLSQATPRRYPTQNHPAHPEIYNVGFIV